MKKAFLVLILVVLIPLAGDAQCAMCKAVVENNADGVAIADGLNKGIVYLMAFPYLLMGAVGYAIYRHKKQRS